MVSDYRPESYFEAIEAMLQPLYAMRLIIIVLLTLTFAVIAEEPVPVPSAGSLQSEGVALKLPKAVGYRKLGDHLHEYRITGLYVGSGKQVDATALSSTYRWLIPDGLDCQMDFKQRTATFQTSRELTRGELIRTIDDLAKSGGDFPYWAELQARDLMPSALTTSLRYTASPAQESPPAGMAWFPAPRDKALRIPLAIGGEDLGTLLITPASASCMCHTRYSVRILDAAGGVVWQDDRESYVGIHVALSQGEGKHQIWIMPHSHGSNEPTWLVRAHFEQAQPKSPTH